MNSGDDGGTKSRGLVSTSSLINHSFLKSLKHETPPNTHTPTPTLESNSLLVCVLVCTSGQGAGRWFLGQLREAAPLQTGAVLPVGGRSRGLHDGLVSRSEKRRKNVHEDQNQIWFGLRLINVLTDGPDYSWTMGSPAHDQETRPGCLVDQGVVGGLVLSRWSNFLSPLNETS